MPLCSECVEVQNILDLDIERLILELGKQKGNNLSEQEQCYLCLSLLGNEPMDIAKKYNEDRCRYDFKQKKPNLTAEELETAVKQELQKIASQNIRPYLSNTISSYVKNLMGVNDAKYRPSWSRVMYFLKQNGYTMVDLSGESKKIKIRLGAKPSDQAIVDGLRKLKSNPNISIEFKEFRGDEQND